MTTKIERRFTAVARQTGVTTAPALRLLTTTTGRIAIGYASVFHVPGDSGTEYELFHDLKERIARGAFDRALRERHDTVGLFNHDPSLVLGRVSSGTLRLSVDGRRGLKYEIDLPATTVGNDLAYSLTRRDITGSSFGFRVTKQKFTTEGSYDIRTILDLQLMDVSPVTYPAYAATSVQTGGASRADFSRMIRLDAIAQRAREVQMNEYL